MASEKWFYMRAKQAIGPITRTELGYLMVRGRLTTDCQVRQGEDGPWRPLSTVPGIDTKAPVDVTLPATELVFGRHHSCDQTLNDPLVSLMHARIRRNGSEFLLEDLRSSNGTFLNGQRVYTPALVKAGDQIGLGRYIFVLSRNGTLAKQDFQGNLVLEARDLSVDVPRRRLLDNVSLTIYPGEFVGLMGPSGAGKSTLLSALNGYAPPTAGRVLVNGYNLYTNYDQFSSHIGYVPQDDIVHRELTVCQALTYTAQLRLPPDFSRAEIRQRVTQVMDQLGLRGTETIVIGSPERKGISGGQRKRVNLAMELLTDPLLLFLDEPTSGLSSEDTMRVMKLLRELANAGKSILLTIHQPSLDAFRLLDNLIVISREACSSGPGGLVYYGPAFPQAIEFFNPDRPAGGDALQPDEVLRGYSRRAHQDWLNRFIGSRYYREYVRSRAGGQVAGPASRPSPMRHERFDARQWLTLSARNFAIKAKDRWNTLILLAQAPIVGLLIPAVYGGELSKELTFENSVDVVGALAPTMFLTMLAALWFGCSNSIREIVGEWAVYTRERMVNLSRQAYLLSKLTTLCGLCVVQCAILLGLVYQGCSLQGPVVAMFLLLLTISLVGVGLGLLISALAKTTEVAIAILPILLLPMVMLGGVMKPIHRMPRAVQTITHLMPSRWGFEALLLLEADVRSPITLALPDPKNPVDTIEKSHGWADDYFPDEHRLGTAVSGAVLAAMLCSLIAAVHAAIRFRDLRSRVRRGRNV